jgi:membrane-bound lytic murein transglycosylase B
MRILLIGNILALFICVSHLHAENTPPPPATANADAQREQAIADYTQKMRDANYPALFDKAAQEFNVPPDVLKAVSFAETRWTQLQWPPGETASPDTGMPHAYGIMSLWDND